MTCRGRPDCQAGWGFPALAWQDVGERAGGRHTLVAHRGRATTAPAPSASIFRVTPARACGPTALRPRIGRMRTPSLPGRVSNSGGPGRRSWTTAARGRTGPLTIWLPDGHRLPDRRRRAGESPTATGGQGLVTSLLRGGFDGRTTSRGDPGLGDRA